MRSHISLLLHFSFLLSLCSQNENSSRFTSPKRNIILSNLNFTKKTISLISLKFLSSHIWYIYPKRILFLWRTEETHFSLFFQQYPSEKCKIWRLTRFKRFCNLIFTISSVTTIKRRIVCI